MRHYILDFRKEFKECVINNFVNTYKKGMTPNPCIECNKYMKFGLMYKKAKELGCKYIATGHYAKTAYSEKYGRWVIKKANALSKDQTYVLWRIPKEIIEYIVFPLGNFQSKDEIRNIARDHNLQLNNKSDSEDICFIPDGNYKNFLEHNSMIKAKKGDIVNLDGEILGKHYGLYNYTIGQRKGLGIQNKVPLFVLAFDKIKNQVIVGEEKDLYKKEVLAKNINMLLFNKFKNLIEIKTKTRYSAKPTEAKLLQDGRNIKVIFKEPQRAITPGQSIVFYMKDVLVRRWDNKLIRMKRR